MSIKIALAGNPNCGKTTLFNTLTGSNQFVGNWPGVTVEKKEGRLKNHDSVIITDLPGIYSLSPYTLEEVVARNYLINESPDVILNIIDGTNLERNLYLTMQLSELGIQTVIAINMMDVVRKRGDKINIDKLSALLGCEIIEISELKNIGIDKLTEIILKAAVATVMGLVAKEEIVGVFGVLDFEGMGKLSAYSFLIFNLLCAPCFAAIGAIKREMNSFKWTLFAIGYQCLFAYAVALIVYQIGSAIGGNLNIIGLAAAVITSVFLIYMIVRPQKKSVKE